MRAWLVGTPLGNAGWLSFVWCAGIIVVSIPLTAWMFRRRASH
jgi:ABC-2 type transport system permease protein